MSHFLREPFTSMVNLLIGGALAIVSAQICRYQLRKYRSRVRLRDHVVEVSEDFAIPRRCVSCSSPKAPYTLIVESVVLGQAWIAAVSSNPRPEFAFHFCLYCSRRLRRRRRYAIYAVAANFMIPVSAIALMLFVPRSSLTFFGFDGGALLFMLILVSVLAAPLVIVVSLHLHHTNPFVSIIHTGVGTILFAFANQMFRDYFARLNGEDFTPPL